jgi:hypothetical protein
MGGRVTYEIVKIDEYNQKRYSLPYPKVGDVIVQPRGIPSAEYKLLFYYDSENDFYVLDDVNQVKLLIMKSIYPTDSVLYNKIDEVLDKQNDLISRIEGKLNTGNTVSMKGIQDIVGILNTINKF